MLPNHTRPRFGQFSTFTPKVKRKHIVCTILILWLCFIAVVTISEAIGADAMPPKQGWTQATPATDPNIILLIGGRAKGKGFTQLDLGEGYYLAIPAAAKLRPNATLRLCPKAGPDKRACIIHREEPRGVIYHLPRGHFGEADLKNAPECPKDVSAIDKPCRGTHGN